VKRMVTGLYLFIFALAVLEGSLFVGICSAIVLLFRDEIFEAIA